MGMRFRKSIKVAPGVKINLNKNSISTTIGSKGAHYTVNSNGNRTATVGIPGTGVSYSTTSKSGSVKGKKDSSNVSQNTNPKPSGKKKKGKGCLTIIIAILVLGAIGSLMSPNKLTKITISADTKTIYDINDTIPITLESEPSDANLDNLDYKTSGGTLVNTDGNISFSAEKAGKYNVYATCDDVKSNSLSFTVEDKKALEERKAQEQAEAERLAAEQAQLDEQKKAEEAAVQAQTQQPQEPMVWIPQSGSKYHNKPDCGNMDPNTATQITKSEAEARSYTPCGRCY